MKLTLAALAARTLTGSLMAGVQKKGVDIKAPDGVNLKGTYFSSGQPTGVAVPSPVQH